jgi:hypothetical protein
VFGLLSAVDYFWKFWRVLDEGVKQRRRLELIELDRNKRKLEKASRTFDQEHGAGPDSSTSAVIR